MSLRKSLLLINRFSNQRVLTFRALKQVGMTIKDVELVEMPPTCYAGGAVCRCRRRRSLSVALNRCIRGTLQASFPDHFRNGDLGQAGKRPDRCVGG